MILYYKDTLRGKIFVPAANPLPLLAEWAARHKPDVVYHRPDEWVEGDTMTSLGDYLLFLPDKDERNRHLQPYWVILADLQGAAYLEIRLIAAMVYAAQDFGLARYTEAWKRLAQVGYAETDLDTIPAPPPELEIAGVGLLPANPDPFPGEGSAQNPVIERRRYMKAAGLLITLTDAAAILKAPSHHTVSNYITRGKLRAWPDPDDHRRRVVLQAEVEALAKNPLKRR